MPQKETRTRTWVNEVLGYPTLATKTKASRGWGTQHSWGSPLPFRRSAGRQRRWTTKKKLTVMIPSPLRGLGHSLRAFPGLRCACPGLFSTAPLGPDSCDGLVYAMFHSPRVCNAGRRRLGQNQRCYTQQWWSPTLAIEKLARMGHGDLGHSNFGTALENGFLKCTVGKSGLLKHTEGETQVSGRIERARLGLRPFNLVTESDQVNRMHMGVAAATLLPFSAIAPVSGLRAKMLILPDV